MGDVPLLGTKGLPTIRRLLRRSAPMARRPSRPGSSGPAAVPAVPRRSRAPTRRGRQGPRCSGRPCTPGAGRRGPACAGPPPVAVTTLTMLTMLMVSAVPTMLAYVPARTRPVPTGPAPRGRHARTDRTCPPVSSRAEPSAHARPHGTRGVAARSASRVPGAAHPRSEPARARPSARERSSAAALLREPPGTWRPRPPGSRALRLGRRGSAAGLR